MRRWAFGAAVGLAAFGAALWQAAKTGPVALDDARYEPDRHSLEKTRPSGPPAAPARHSAGQAESLWRAADERSAGSPPTYDDDWSKEGRILVDVSGAVAAAPTWREGDRVAVDIPQLGESWESTIDRIDEGPGRSRSARGLFVGADGRSRRFVVTVGPMRVFAYIDTAHGPYELVGDDRLGWLMPTSSMLAGWDFSEPDYMLPERGDADIAR